MVIGLDSLNGILLFIGIRQKEKNCAMINHNGQKTKDLKYLLNL